MTIKLKYSDEPIEVTGMSFDEDGVFKGYFKEGDPAAPVKLDEFYPKEDCDTVNGRIFVPAELAYKDVRKIIDFYKDTQSECCETGNFLSDGLLYKMVLQRFLEYKHKQLFKDIKTRPNK